MKFIVSDHLLCKVHRKNRKGQPFKDCRKKKHHKERKIWMWFDVWKWKRNAGHTWQVDKDLELPLSWVKYGSWTCSSKSTALYIWCIKNDKMISHKQNEKGPLVVVANKKGIHIAGKQGLLLSLQHWISTILLSWHCPKGDIMCNLHDSVPINNSCTLETGYPARPVRS